MINNRFFSQLILIVSLWMYGISVSAEEAYKWVDEKGRVHYADKPPVQANDVAPVQIEAAPSEAQKQESEAIKQQRIKNAAEYQNAREEREARAEKQAEQRKAQAKRKKEKASADDNSDPGYIPPCSGLLNNRQPCILGLPVNKPRPRLPIAKPVRSPRLPARK